MKPRQRIELGEINRVMQALPDVEQAVTHACVINQAAATGGDSASVVGYLVLAIGLPWIPAHCRRSFVKHCRRIWCQSFCCNCRSCH
ncbi:hypothetical protein ACNKHK_03110 [Shigella flexneri]